MNIEYVARKVTLSDQTRSLCERKVSKVTKYFNDILDIRVEVAQERHLHVVEMFINGKDFDIRASSQHKDLSTAIQDAAEKLEMQARRNKNRLKDRKQRPSEAEVAAVPDWSEDVIEPTSVAGGTPTIVKRSSITIKPMSIEEAQLQLESSNNDFIVYLNAGTDRVNVLYRRRDGNLGLITPEF